MKNLLEYILIHLVDHPDEVVIDETKDEQGAIYVIHVHSEDVGRVIGKGGSVIQAIRQIARVRAIKEGERVRIDVYTDDDARESVPTQTPAAEVSEPEVQTEIAPEIEQTEEVASETAVESSPDQDQN